MVILFISTNLSKWECFQTRNQIKEETAQTPLTMVTPRGIEELRLYYAASYYGLRVVPEVKLNI